MTNRFTYRRRSNPNQLIEAYQFHEMSGNADQTGFFPSWFLDLIQDGLQYNTGNGKWRIQLTGSTPLALDDKWWIIRIPIIEAAQTGKQPPFAKRVTYALGTCTPEYFDAEFESCRN